MMFNLINALLICASIFIASFMISKKISTNRNSLDAYYNTQGAFAGFVQKKSGRIRACEFSSHGTVLSCSNWFEEKTLKQGKNLGINEEEI